MPFAVKPLSLHYRIPQLLDDRALNSFSVKGDFSIRQIHDWIQLSLPEVPPRPESTSSGVLHFQHALVGSILRCSYRKGSGTFESDNVSTISIIKEAITKLATERKVQIRTSFEIKTDTMISVVDRLHPKICHFLELSMRYEIVAGLEEVRSHISGDDTSDFLAPEYTEILRNADQIRREVESRPKALDALIRAAVSLFVDANKFKGFDVSNRTEEIVKALKRDYEREKVLELFSSFQ